MLLRRAVKCDGKSCRDPNQYHTHHLTWYGVFWWNTFHLHRGKLLHAREP